MIGKHYSRLSYSESIFKTFFLYLSQWQTAKEHSVCPVAFTFNNWKHLVLESVKHSKTSQDWEGLRY